MHNPSVTMVSRAVGSNFQLVRPRYCDHNTAACNRHGMGVRGDVPPSARSAEAFLYLKFNIVYTIIILILHLSVSE